MYSLETIKAINSRPPIRRDNFNRDSSSVQSAKGFVIHSGIHRSTAFISKDEHPDCWFAFCYWREQGQAAVNGFIESIIGDTTLDDAEAEAFRRSRPAWTVRRVTSGGKLLGTGELFATKASGRLNREAAAFTFRHLHARTA